MTFVLAEDRFTCEDCEHKYLAFNYIHTKEHTLVRVVEKVVEVVVSAEERLRAVEGQLDSIQDRLEKMEVFFSKLLGRRAENSPEEVITKHGVQTVVEKSKNAESNNRGTKY